MMMDNFTERTGLHSSKQNIYEICKYENGLGCWQAATLNLLRVTINTKLKIQPRIYFWHEPRVLHAYLELEGKVYSNQITWPDLSCPEIDFKQLQQLLATGDVEDITVACVYSQLDRLLFEQAGDNCWKPIKTDVMMRHLPELTDTGLIMEIADRWGYRIEDRSTWFDQNNCNANRIIDSI